MSEKGANTVALCWSPKDSYWMLASLAGNAMCS